MPLNIETFSNAVGGNAFYKAITHPLAAEPARALLAKLKASGPVAIYDPQNLLAAFDALFPLDRTEIAGVFVLDVSHIGRNFRGAYTQPVTEHGAPGERTDRRRREPEPGPGRPAPSLPGRPADWPQAILIQIKK